MSDDPTTYQRLAERFPAEDHKSRKQGGRDLTYLPGEKVIARLNAVLGFSWSFRVVNQGATDVEAWVLGELTANIEGEQVTRQQYGNQDLARGERATTDLFKSAATDALKKCATTIGVGLYLYDEDERREVEQEMRQAKQAPRQSNPTNRPSGAAGRASASTPPASGAASSSSSTTGTPAPSEPTPLKTKLELIADVQKGLEYARSLGLVMADVDCGPMNRAEIEEFLTELRERCRTARAASRAAS